MLVAIGERCAQPRGCRDEPVEAHCARRAALSGLVCAKDTEWTGWELSVRSPRLW